MTVLVYGPYPPSPGYEAAEVFALVRSLVSDGDNVTVVSPVPSAAHHHVDLGTPAGGLALWRLVPGHDRVIVRLDAAGLLAGSDPPRALPGRFALGRALRRATRLELRLDRVPSPVSSRWVAAVVLPADDVVVSSEEERRSLLDAGAPIATVRVEAPEQDSSGGRPADLPSWSGRTREALQRDVRRRAAAVREGRTSAEPGTRASATAPLREIAPLGHAPIRSPKPGVAFVKRLVRKLVGWQLEPIIQHVNRLHQATVASVDRAGDQGSSSSTRAAAVARNDRSDA